MKSVLYWNSETWLLKRFQILNLKWRVPQEVVQLQGYHHHLRYGEALILYLILSFLV